jgi:hypothetical protein
MTDEEKLDLSPWAKFILYKKFPAKLLLHVLLCIACTTHVMLINAVFDSYSRSIGATWAYLLFPQGYQSFEERNMGLGYELYTVPDTLAHAQQLVSSYYSLPYTAVDSIVIYTDDGDNNSTTNPDLAQCDFTVPTLKITRAADNGQQGSLLSSSSMTYELHNATSGWPLSTSSRLANATESYDVEYMEEFFSDMVKMEFTFAVKSEGVTSGSAGTFDLCVCWDVTVEYDLGARGQIVVGIFDAPVKRCDTLPITGPLEALSFSILIMSIMYSVLLVKATFHHVELLKKIYKTQTMVEGLEKKTKKRSKKKKKKKATTASTESMPSSSSPGAITPPPCDLVSNPSQTNTDALTQPLLSNDSMQLMGSDIGLDINSASMDVSDTDQNDWMSGSPEPVLQQARSSLSNNASAIARAARRRKLLAQATTATNAWAALSFKDKYLYIFNLWFVVSLLGNILSIIYSIQFVSSNNDVYADDDYRLVMGSAVALYWFSLAQFLEYFPRFYLLIWTLKTGIPRVMQFFTGIAPFFVGYALLGMILFGDQCILFGSFSDTCCTLFSVVNGDSIHDVFQALSFFFPLGDIYLYVYIFLFMYVVLMSVIAIVEEAFFDSLRSQGIAASEIDEYNGNGNGGNNSRMHSYDNSNNNNNNKSRIALRNYSRNSWDGDVVTSNKSNTTSGNNNKHRTMKQRYSTTDLSNFVTADVHGDNNNSSSSSNNRGNNVSTTFDNSSTNANVSSKMSTIVTSKVTSKGNVKGLGGGLGGGLVVGGGGGSGIRGGGVHTSPYGSSWNDYDKASVVTFNSSSSSSNGMSGMSGMNGGNGTGSGGGRRESYKSRLMPPMLREVLRNVDGVEGVSDGSSSDSDDSK